jgi:hypothetical protein
MFAGVFAAAVVAVMMLAIIALVTGHLPSHTGPGITPR